MNNLTETEIKLKDASIQLQLAIDHIGNEDYFRACINSFISFTRSITMIMEKESSKNPELLEWYKSNTAKLSKDPLMRFFNQQRVHTIHRGNIKPKSQSIPIKHPLSKAETSEFPNMSIWVFDDIQKFIPEETGNVLRLCDEYLQFLAKMVSQWKHLKELTESPREVIERLQNELKKCKAWNFAFSSELEQSKLTIELLNDTLKSKGDNSYSHFATELIIRIDRLLNPEKYANAPTTQSKVGTVSRNESGSLEIYTILVSPTEADGQGAEGVYATIRNDYAKDKEGNPIFDKEFGFWMWGASVKGKLPSETAGFNTAKEAEEAALRIYKLLRY
jgi:hypothetical protein